MYLDLMREGHDVRIYVERRDKFALAGLIVPVADWRAELPWVGRDGIVLVEPSGLGALQDGLRQDGYRVIGSSAYGDRLELDRGFGQQALHDAGLPIADSIALPSPAAARAWLREHPGRYAMKADSNRHTTFVGEHAAGADLDFVLGGLEGGGVLLQRRLEGVEIGVGGYFDGRDFLRPVNLDFEHKRFFPGDMGEMTGEMGTLAAFEGAEKLFDATLGRFAPQLRAAGHVGYVNLNMIVNAEGAWPLEFTCRFGNPGFAVLAALQADGWGDLLARMAGDGGTFRTHAGWSVAIVLTVPPFPATRDVAPTEDPPVMFHVPPDDPVHHHYIDMRAADGTLFVHRRSGHVMIVTGIGASIPEAQQAARARARNVIVPEIRWRQDIGERARHTDIGLLRGWGWLA